jgi:hypothetical protein
LRVRGSRRSVRPPVADVGFSGRSVRPPVADVGFRPAVGGSSLRFEVQRKGISRQLSGLALRFACGVSRQD